MEPTQIVEYVKQLGPWVTAFSEIVWFILNEVILKLLGVLLIIARLTPTEADNKFINRLLNTVNIAVGRKNHDSNSSN